MDEEPLPLPNPWRTMWMSPRITIRRLIESDARPSWVPVVALAAVSYALMSIQVDETGAFSASRSAMPMVLAALQTIGTVLVGPFILAFVGGWFGSDADPSDIRQAVAWADVPVAATVVLWIPVLLGTGTAAFGPDEPPMDTTGQWLGSLAFFGIAVCYLWGVGLLVAGVAEAQRLSVGKALLTILIPLVPVLFLQALV